MKLTPQDPASAFPLTVEAPGRDTETYYGRIVITWPKTNQIGVPLGAWGTQIENYDTGKQIITVTNMTITLAADGRAPGLLYADLTQLVDEQGKRLPDKDFTPVPDPDNPGEVRTGVFRYYVVEMRTAQ